VSRLRGAVDKALHHPVTEVALVGLILVSVGLLVAEGLFHHDAARYQQMERLGDAITWVFVVELAARFWVAPKKSRFLRRYWIDILAVVPVIRPLRLFRAVRLLRLFRAGLLINRRLSTFQGVFQGAASEFTLLGALAAMLVVAGGVTMFLAERGANPDLATFRQGLWFSLFSAIGGEPIGATPVTNTGRLVTLGLMLGGLTVFGVFVGTISASMVARLSQRMKVNEMDIDELTQHIVVCGWNHSGHTMLHELFSARQGPPPSVVLVTEEADLPGDLDPTQVRRELLYHVSGDCTRVEVLERAGIRRARAAIILSDATVPTRPDQDRDARTVLAGLTIERLTEQKIFTCAQLNDRQNESLLRMAGVEEIVVTREYSGYILGSAGRNLGMVTVLDDLLTARHGNAFYRTTLPKELDGHTVEALHGLLLERHGAVLVAWGRGPEGAGEGAGAGKVQVNPPRQTRVSAGDTLVVIAEGPLRW